MEVKFTIIGRNYEEQKTLLNDANFPQVEQTEDVCGVRKFSDKYFNINQAMEFYIPEVNKNWGPQIIDTTIKVIVGYHRGDIVMENSGNN